LAALLLFLVLMLFFFPVQVGSFQATHGPTTTLKESGVEITLQAMVTVLSATVLTSLFAWCCFGFTRRYACCELRPGDEKFFSLRC
jgi:hypothetical protein